MAVRQAALGALPAVPPRDVARGFAQGNPPEYDYTGGCGAAGLALVAGRLVHRILVSATASRCVVSRPLLS